MAAREVPLAYVFVPMIVRPLRTVFLGAFLVLALAGIWAASHRGEPPAPGRVTLTWVTDDNPARQEQMRLFRDFARAQSRPDVDIRLDPNNAGMDKVVIQSVGGVGPDLFDVRGRMEAVFYAEAAVSEDITDAGRRGDFGVSRLWPALRSAIKIDGRQYSQPTNCTPTCIFYNKAVFDRFGIPYPHGDWTWEDFVRVAKGVSGGRGADRVFGVMNYSLNECIWQAGGHFFSPDGLRCTLDTPEAIEGARFFRDMQHTYHIMPTASEENAVSSSGGWGQGALNYFLGGRLAMIATGRYAIVQWRTVPALRYGVAPMPRHRRRANYLLWRATAVNAKGPHRDAAMLFMKFLTSEPYCRQINDSGDSIAALPKYVKTPDFLYDPAHPSETDNALWASEMANSRDVEVSPFANPFVVNQVIQDQIDLLRGGHVTPEDAMRNAAQRVNALITRNLRGDPMIRARREALQPSQTTRP